jgi:regulator of sirC expression with transglutaminase-like and TPR domain
VERTLLVTPLSPTANRARGILLVRLGRHEEAVEQLEAYLHVAPGSADAEHVQEMVDALKEGRSPTLEDMDDA